MPPPSSDSIFFGPSAHCRSAAPDGVGSMPMRWQTRLRRLAGRDRRAAGAVADLTVPHEHRMAFVRLLGARRAAIIRSIRGREHVGVRMVAHPGRRPRSRRGPSSNRRTQSVPSTATDSATNSSRGNARITAHPRPPLQGLLGGEEIGPPCATADQQITRREPDVIELTTDLTAHPRHAHSPGSEATIGSGRPSCDRSQPRLSHRCRLTSRAPHAWPQAEPT